MNVKILTIIFVSIIFSSAFGQIEPERTGIALGYMTTPNSIVYRSTWSENSAIDVWVDIPEISAGDFGGFRLGAGSGYAIFLDRQKYFCFMVRPQLSFAYISETMNYFEIGAGVAGSAVAYLDSLGVPNTDVYAGISLGSVARFGDGTKTFDFILTKDRPFGILIGVMRYF
ncbi:hypothetical protein DRQ29_06795 [bacterium]|nr:hypothetical protein [bacterium]RKZ25143.1 MAG: hypothetical protein DRQ29_06795 [bacterium]